MTEREVSATLRGEGNPPLLSWATPARVLGVVLGAVFLAELLLMMAFDALGSVSPVAKAPLDAGLLTLFLVPVLWPTVFRVVQNLRQELAVRERLDAELRRAVASAESAMRTQSEVVANMGREVRAPMVGVAGLLDQALEDPLSDACREYLRVARTSVASLLRTFNDFLRLAKAERCELPLEDVPFAVYEAMREVAEGFAANARDKGLELRLRCEPGTDAVVIGDPGRLRHVLRNLLGNAVKFTDQGEVVLRVSPAPVPGNETEEGTVTLLFSVADTGPGIPRAIQERLFRESPSAPEAGLGLSVSRGIVTCLGGALRVDSEPGRGSLFSFTARFGVAEPGVRETLGSAPQQLEEVLVRRKLLNSQAQPVAFPAAAAGMKEDAGPAPRVLVAEDMPPNRLLAVALLETRGWQADAVADGAEAISGWERGTGRRIPIVAMTAHAMEGDRERCLAAGMDGYVAKPIAQEELFRVVEQCLAGPRPTSPVGGTPPADLNRALRALGGDVGLLSKLVRYFLRDQLAQMSALAGAVEAGDPQAVERAAHRIKSAVGHFRAQDAWNLSQALETMGREGQLTDAGEILATLRAEVDRLTDYLADRFPDASDPRDRGRTNAGVD